MHLNTTLIIFLVIYFLAIFVEAAYSFYKNKGLYNAKDTLTNLSLGILGVGFRVLTKGSWIALWIYLFQFAPYKVEPGLLSWIILFFCNELVYYWFHRLSHENRLLWAVHVNHHSSEHLNLSTSARIPFLNIIFHNLFWIPLLFLGFSPEMIFAVETVSFLVTFAQHNQFVGRLPVIERFFNTPSLHRVHHASNPEYINKNYGNVLIIYDRLFGTYQLEEEDVKIRYGITKNINTHNLFKVIFHEWIDIFKELNKNKTQILVKKFMVFSFSIAMSYHFIGMISSGSVDLTNHHALFVIIDAFCIYGFIKKPRYFLILFLLLMAHQLVTHGYPMVESLANLTVPDAIDLLVTAVMFVGLYDMITHVTANPGKGPSPRLTRQPIH